MKWLVLLFFLPIQLPAQTCELLCNPDFENPPGGGWDMFTNATFPCWRTTEQDSDIERWVSGFNGVPAYSGDYFIELNAYYNGKTLYQNFTVAPGTPLKISFAHRGRAGVDTMSVAIGPVGGKDTILGTYADSTLAWGYYHLNYTIPLGLGNQYSIRFISVYAALNIQGIGNFLDDVSVLKASDTLSVQSTETSCFGGNNGQASVSVSGGQSPFTYSWSPSGGSGATANNLAGATYTVTVTDANGCLNTAAVVITQPVAIKINSISITNPSCGLANGIAIASASGGTGSLTYNWSNGTSARTNTGLSAATYSITVTDANSCTIGQTAKIQENPKPVVILSVKKPIPCFGDSGSILATISGAKANYTYSWSNGESEINSSASLQLDSLPGNSYSVTITDTDGCSASDSILLKQPKQLQTPRVTTIHSFCGLANGSATALSSGGTGTLTYSWSNGSSNQTAAGLAAANYSVLVNDSNNCSSAVKFSISDSGSIVTTAGSNQTVCPDSIVQLSASGGTAYSWSPSAGLSNPAIPNPKDSALATETYTVTIRTGTCIAKDSITVTVLPLPLISLNKDTEITKGTSAQLLASGGAGYLWYPGSSLNDSLIQNPLANPTQSTTYTVVISSPGNCPVSDTITVRVKDIFCGDVFVPNAFSPNHDGENDVFYVRGKCIVALDVEIFSRWGEKLFEITNPSMGWDGTYQGKDCQGDVYTYFMKAGLLDGGKVTKKGYLLLLR